MGRFSVDLEVSNNKDRIRAEDSTITPEQVRRLTIRVDCTAHKLVPRNPQSEIRGE